MLSLLLSAALAAGGQPGTDFETPVVEDPHPMITEVLYGVPPGDDGDAWPDGNRSPTGDEFVELSNPHRRTINLRGYTISDRNRGGTGEVSFTFPSFRLKPGEVVVVFNGNGQSFTGGRVGTAERAPQYKHDTLGCFVFTMNNDNRYAAFSNSGDWVLLSDPEDRPVHVVHWGEFDEDLPPAGVVERVDGRLPGSACRYWMGGPMVAHHHIDGEDLSPGKHPVGPSPEEARRMAEESGALGDASDGGP
ncbi:MAG: lamin tail domain-containing protein [Planctomycetota bacterium]